MDGTTGQDQVVDRLSELRTWRAEVVERLSELRVRLDQTSADMKEAEQRLQLLDGLLAIEDPGGPTSTALVSPAVSDSDFLSACESLIREAGKPLHIKDLHRALLDGGIPIPGRGTEANVISRVQRSNGRITRVGRGMYAIPEFGMEESRPTKRRFKRKTR